MFSFCFEYDIYLKRRVTRESKELYWEYGMDGWILQVKMG